MKPNQTNAWAKLATLASDQALSLKDAIQNPALSPLSLGGCTFDFSKQRLNENILTALLDLAKECNVEALRDEMFSGAKINRSENRAVLHSALRHGAPQADSELVAAVSQVQAKMRDLASAVRDGSWRGYTGKAITDVVHIGIGGSHLGPELVVSALPNTGPTMHFAANIDGHELYPILAGVNPETTLFIIASKSFTTLETQVNAQTARSWFLERTCSIDAIANHFLAVTTNLEASAQFGLPQENLFPMWDWVGGRFSLWSAVGLPIMIATGRDAFDALLAGAREVDVHFATAAAEENIPLLSALCATWNYNFFGAASLAVLSYDERLALLPDYLQQLEMESNGKSIASDGEPIAVHTMPILWGGTGTRGQHAYHQLLHQGTRAYAADFIIVAHDDLDDAEHHNWLLANALAQSQAMAIGFDAPDSEPHRGVVGEHPTTTIVLDELGPRQLGALLAVYEHKVFAQGAIWGINSFDQWGVELGKKLAHPIFETLANDTNHPQDTATQRLIDHLRS